MKNTIETLLTNTQIPTEEKVKHLTANKPINVPGWEELEKEYNPEKHPVMDKGYYPDIVKGNRIEKVTRVTVNLQKLASKRMAELVAGIPIKRIYKPTNDRQKQIAKYLETIFKRNRIDSVNLERCELLFSSCEILTLWYAVPQQTNVYGFNAPFKLRCRTFSPRNGEKLYPLFDEYGDLQALTIAYNRPDGATYYDTYTATRHTKYKHHKNDWDELENEPITIGKIPAVYCFRPTPIWEDASKIVYEIEWALSRNGNYLRQNSKPLFVVFASQEIAYNQEGNQNEEFRSVLQFPQGSNAQYVTWQQAVDNLQFYVSELRNLFFTQLQLIDWSYEKMSQQALSGESRKQLFIDAQLKVKDESGRLLEFFDRELNVVKAFLKAMLGSEYHNDIDALQIETVITPFSINDEKDTIANLITANGGAPIISQKESIELFGHSQDVEKTLSEIKEQSKQELFEPTDL